MADIPCVGAVVFDESGRLLLVQRANPPAQGKWSLPGGRQEPDESSIDGVVREVLEETGLVVRVEREVGTVQRQAPSGDTYVIRDFVCTTPTTESVVAGDDASDARFFEIAELGDVDTSEGLLEALREWRLIP
ncbi:MAG: NUDIX domain-containing protein [Actinomycetota bacterium]|jgi:ADP-ribose pyrophosphatase YjhB (NUDIX family)|nr:NUDIX domain-containing protein [Actinomycetota bacterium]